MKKSILAVSAAAAIGGLGFAGAAHAVYYFGDGAANQYVGVNVGGVIGGTHTTKAATATEARINEGGLGTYLFTPYFTTQGFYNTLVTLVNTDTTNGKIVKVRFRGAANSEDLLDFQVFLSPGDVWTGSLQQDGEGFTNITTPDKSCTLPEKLQPRGPANFDSTFRINRLVASLSADAKKAQTREGYIEYLNMADIVPGSPLYSATKHVNGVAPCSTEFAKLVPMLNSTSLGTTADGPLPLDMATNITALGMSAPSGGLSGTWSIYSNSNTVAYGDNHIAVQATDALGTAARGRISYAPQREILIGNEAVVKQGTADPVLTRTWASAYWNDLPDMSTPIIAGQTNPTAAIVELSKGLSKETISNEFVATLGALRDTQPWDTDWVVSHATRRYYVTLDSSGAPRWNTNEGASAFYVYGGNVGVVNNMICQAGTISGYDREESEVGATFSPGGTPWPFCGEVNTLTFNGVNGATTASTTLQASVTNQRVKLWGSDGLPVQAGWATLVLAKPAGGYGAPTVGFAATANKNTTTNGNFGINARHRYTTKFGLVRPTAN